MELNAEQRIILSYEKRIKELTEGNAELTRTCTALTRKVQVLDEQYNSMLDRNMELGDEVDGLKAHLDVSVAEQTRLADEVADWKAIAEGYQKQFEDCAEDRARLTEENERLRVVADMSNTTLTDALRIVSEFCDSRIKRARADIVREFVEKLGCKAYTESTVTGYRYMVVFIEDIDETAQEMLEG